MSERDEPVAHPCSPEGWPLTREGWLEDGYGPVNPVDQVGLGVSPSVGVVEPVGKLYENPRAFLELSAKLWHRGVEGQAQEILVVLKWLGQEVLDVHLGALGHRADVEVELPAWELHGSWWKRPVFVGVVQAVKNGEQMSFGVRRAMVWLKLFDPLDPGGIYAAEPVTDRRSPIRLVLNAGERVTIRGGAVVRKDELPNEVVERGAEIAQQVSENKREIDRRLLFDLPSEVHGMRRLGIEMHRDRIWVALHELSLASVERFSVSFRPTQLRDDDGQISGHDLPRVAPHGADAIWSGSERQGPSSDKSARQLGKDREVGVEPDPIQTSDAEREE
jgi:hypothetical protein